MIHQTKCSCAHNSDGTVTTYLCPAHAAVDPCLTMASVTGRRRKGTINRGVCSACGHRRTEQKIQYGYTNGLL